MAVDKEFVRRVLTEQRVKKVETKEELLKVVAEGLNMIRNDLNHLYNTILKSKEMSIEQVIYCGLKRFEDVLTKEEMYKIIDVFMEFPYLIKYFIKTNKIDFEKIDKNSNLYGVYSYYNSEYANLMIFASITNKMLSNIERAYLWTLVPRLNPNRTARPEKKEAYSTVLGGIIEAVQQSFALLNEKEMEKINSLYNQVNM